MKPAITWNALRPWIANAALILLGTGLVLLTRQYVNEATHYWIGGSGCSGWSVWLFVAAVLVIKTQPTNRATFGIVIIVAVTMQLTTVLIEPFSSSDVYRYVWDGIAQHAHINPYRYVPGDPALAYLRGPNQEVFDGINRRDYAHTIYPPVAQMLYYLITFFSATVEMMKLAMVGLLCVAAAAITACLRTLRRPREELLLFAWCPLLAWEIGGAGHVDAAIIAFISLAFFFRLRELPWLTGLFLGLAVMTKFYPLVLFPALYRRGDWKMPATLSAVIAIGYAMYSSVGMKVFGFLGGYAKEEGIESGARFFLLEWMQRLPGLHGLPTFAFLLLCAVVLGALSLWAWRHATTEDCSQSPRPPKFLRAAMLLGFVMMLLFSPHYPWYIVWLIPLFALTPSFTLLAYLMAFFYGYSTYLADPGPKMFLLNQIIYTFVAAVFLLEYFVLRRLPMHRLFPANASEISKA